MRFLKSHISIFKNYKNISYDFIFFLNHIPAALDRTAAVHVNFYSVAYLIA